MNQTTNQHAPSDTPRVDAFIIQAKQDHGDMWASQVPKIARVLELEIARLSAEREKDIQALQELVRLNHETYKATLAERDKQLAEVKDLTNRMKLRLGIDLAITDQDSIVEKIGHIIYRLCDAEGKFEKAKEWNELTEVETTNLRMAIEGLTEDLETERNPNHDGSLAFFLSEGNQRENDLRAQLLAAQTVNAKLREALQKHINHPNWHPISTGAIDAVALTPDPTLLDEVLKVLEMTNEEVNFTVGKLGATVSTGGLIQLRAKARQLLSRLRQSTRETILRKPYVVRGPHECSRSTNDPKDVHYSLFDPDGGNVAHFWKREDAEFCANALATRETEEKK